MVGHGGGVAVPRPHSHTSRCAWASRQTTEIALLMCMCVSLCAECQWELVFFNNKTMYVRLFCQTCIPMRSRPLAVRAAGTSLAIAMGSARALGGSPSPADLLAPQALCDRYTDETYATMRDDEMRTRAYRSAIERHAPGKLCLDVGTGALALLAIIAARAGAEHVFAIEANAEAAAAARQTVAAEGLEAQITIIEGYSTDVTLPRRVDLLLHEIIGEIASAEGVVAAVLDAGERHLRSGAHPPVSIPARARTLLAPCEFPGSEYFDALPYPMLAAPGAQVRRADPPRARPTPHAARAARSTPASAHAWAAHIATAAARASRASPAPLPRYIPLPAATFPYTCYYIPLPGAQAAQPTAQPHARARRTHGGPRLFGCRTCGVACARAALRVGAPRRAARPLTL